MARRWWIHNASTKQCGQVDRLSRSIKLLISNNIKKFTYIVVCSAACVHWTWNPLKCICAIRLSPIWLHGAACATSFGKLIKIISEVLRIRNIATSADDSAERMDISTIQVHLANRRRKWNSAEKNPAHTHTQRRSLVFLEKAIIKYLAAILKWIFINNTIKSKWNALFSGNISNLNLIIFHSISGSAACFCLAHDANKHNANDVRSKVSPDLLINYVIEFHDEIK